MSGKEGEAGMSGWGRTACGPAQRRRRGRGQVTFRSQAATWQAGDRRPIHDLPEPLFLTCKNGRSNAHLLGVF